MTTIGSTMQLPDAMRGYAQVPDLWHADRLRT